MSNAVYITGEALAAIVKTVAAEVPETGGILGMRAPGIISDFVFDRGENATCEFYIPDTRSLNKALESWQENCISFCGMIHSHLKGRKKLSSSDVIYAGQLMQSMNTNQILMLLVDTDTKDYSIAAFEVFKKAQKLCVKKLGLRVCTRTF